MSAKKTKTSYQNQRPSPTECFTVKSSMIEDLYYCKIQGLKNDQIVQRNWY